MINVVNEAELGYLHLPKEMLIDIDRINSFSDERVVVLTT